VPLGAPAARAAPALAESLRDAVPGLLLQFHCGGGSLKSAMKKADRSGAALALILGDDELAAGEVAVKPLRGDGEQERLDRPALAGRLRTLTD
jgi:histidyl-tRNA synthetase